MAVGDNLGECVFQDKEHSSTGLWPGEYVYAGKAMTGKTVGNRDTKEPNIKRHEPRLKGVVENDVKNAWLLICMVVITFSLAFTFSFC